MHCVGREKYVRGRAVLYSETCSQANIELHPAIVGVELPWCWLLRINCGRRDNISEKTWVSVLD